MTNIQSVLSLEKLRDWTSSLSILQRSKVSNSCFLSQAISIRSSLSSLSNLKKQQKETLNSFVTLDAKLLIIYVWTFWFSRRTKVGSRGDNGISIGLVQHVVKRTICCFRGEAFASVVYASSHLCRNVSDSKEKEIGRSHVYLSTHFPLNALADIMTGDPLSCS